jgi:hypothetical protein
MAVAVRAHEHGEARVSKAEAKAAATTEEIDRRRSLCPSHPASYFTEVRRVRGSFRRI